jgi:membrane associated rhomboid family serine protease
MLVFMVVFMLMFNLMVGIKKAGTVDTTGHVGGAICGLLYGFAFFPRVETPNAIKLRKVG